MNLLINLDFGFISYNMPILNHFFDNVAETWPVGRIEVPALADQFLGDFCE